MDAQTPAGSPSPLHHAAIGQIQGKYGKGVVQYLGIKYASLEDRLAEPQVMEYSGEEEIDATRHGYVLSTLLTDSLVLSVIPFDRLRNQGHPCWSPPNPPKWRWGSSSSKSPS